MKKRRLICLALCLVLVLSVFLTSCQEEEKDVSETVISEVETYALSMWVVTEKALDAATASAVTDALNAITETKFNTRLHVTYLTEDQYRQQLTETIRKNEDARNELLGKVTVEEEKPVVTNEDGTVVTGPVVEYVTNEYGLPEKKFPVLKENQVDIIYIDGYDMYIDYINNGWLKPLDAELSAASKKIKEYVSGTLLNAAKINGATYAIPNNKTIGEYTYMLLDKELMEECSMDGIYNQGKINGLFNQYIYNYLETIRNHYGDQVVPIDATYDECLQLLAHYWSINPDTYDAEEATFSFLGYRYTDPTTLSKGQTVLAFDSLFEDEVFCENYLKLNEYKFDGGYFGEAVEGKKTAIQFRTGDLSDYEKYSEDYYTVIVKYPSVDVDDVFESMFGVYNHTVSESRSMQIVTYLNTNKEFRNVLQYGVEGTHYEFVKDDNGKETLCRLNEDYMMDLFKTGNAFIAYPDPAESFSDDVWEIGKQQNRQALVEPLLNFDFEQIARATIATDSSAPKVGSSGYTYSYTTGYAKDICMENELLKKWIDASDAAGKGVYALHTSAISGQNVTGLIYYYNNNITNAKVEVTDGDGAVTVNYTGSEGNGAEITVISFYGKKNSSNLKWNATVNGTAANTSVTYQNALLNFDFLHTEHYDIDLTSGITKSMAQPNTAVWNWIKACNTAGSTNPFVGTSERTVGEGANAQKVYTYLFYMPKLANPYAVKVQPKSANGALTVEIDYTVDSATALGSSDPQYALFLVTVAADSNVSAVSFDLSVNGGEATVTAQAFEEDPNFTLCGNLDTELLRYVYNFNNAVVGMLNACTNMEELEQLVADLHILLTVPESHPFGDDAYFVTNDISSPALLEYLNTVLNNGKNSFDVETFYWNLYSATSSKEVKRQQENDEGKMVELVENPYTGENYYYYSSPYMLYFNWLKNNGYAK